MTYEPFDPGLQLERTALAWQRTALSLVVGSLAVGRLVEPIIGPVSWVGGAVGLSAGLATLIVSRRRYSTAHEHLVERDPHFLPQGGALILLCTALCALLGLAALLFVASHQMLTMH